MPATETVDPAAQAEFRKLMGLFATGVCVVSFANENGAGDPGISAMTVNSFVSVSLEPMLVCWSIQNAASQFDDYVGADDYAISILAEDQQALARRYAARGDTTLRPEDFTSAANGAPVIAGALAHLECRRWAVYPAGDHTMILGEVQAMSVLSEHHRHALGFFDGRFFPVGS